MAILLVVPVATPAAASSTTNVGNNSEFHRMIVRSGNPTIPRDIPTQAYNTQGYILPQVATPVSIFSKCGTIEHACTMHRYGLHHQQRGRPGHVRADTCALSRVYRLRTLPCCSGRPETSVGPQDRTEM